MSLALPPHGYGCNRLLYIMRVGYPTWWPVSRSVLLVHPPCQSSKPTSSCWISPEAGAEVTTYNGTSLNHHRTMSAFPYPLPLGVHAIPTQYLDLRPDSEVDHALLYPKPVSASDEKNIWFFWHASYANMHPYTKRNIRAWHRRFSRYGWTIRVIDRLPSSPLNIANFLDINDPATFPRAFADGTISGDYALQHTSDLVRWPLLLRYGGVYVDVGMIQIGDLDRLWCDTVGNPNSRFQVLSYNMGGVEKRGLTNYFHASKRDNPLFWRCHRLLLELWAADGGKTSTDGMHSSPLLKEIPLMGGRLLLRGKGSRSRRKRRVEC